MGGNDRTFAFSKIILQTMQTIKTTTTTIKKKQQQQQQQQQQQHSRWEGMMRPSFLQNNITKENK